MFSLSMVKSREDLPDAATGLGFKRAAEIGVNVGRFSRKIVRKWNGDLFLIDAWKHFESGYIDFANALQDKQDAKYAKVVAMFANRPNVHIMRNLSVEAAAQFDDGGLDWIFIDANHCYEAVCEDLTAWWPKLRSGGLFSGHDYLDGVVDGSVFEVKRAVDEFTAKLGLPLPQNITGSWMFVKP